MQSADPRHVHRLLARDGQCAWVGLTRAYGKTFRNGRMVVTCEPAAVRSLLLERVHTERRPAAYKVMGWLPGADGILFMEGEPWRARARALMPAFHRDRVDSFAPAVFDTTRAHLREWETQGRLEDLYGAVQQIGAASVLRMGYGLDPDAPLAVRLGRALVDYKNFTMSPVPRHRIDEFAATARKLLILPVFLARLVRLRRKTMRVRDAVRALLASGDLRGRDGWLGQLAGAGFPDKELAQEINHLYGAFNAIDHVLACALYELGRNPRLALELRRELVSASRDDAPVTRDDLGRLPLLHAFMLETFRRYPVTMGAMRQTGAPLRIGGEELPAGTQVMILLHALHHHPDFWEAPDEFRPERWLPSHEPRVPFSYAPFLDGPRKCIGRSMAETHFLAALPAVVRRCDLRVLADASIPTFMIPRFGRPVPCAVQAAAAV